MAVKIRLSKVGRTHQVSYRIVAQDVRTKRDGKFLEILGFVNSHDKNNSFKINKDRIKFFVSRGATFTPSAKFVFEKGELPPRPKKQRAEKQVQAAAPATPTSTTATESTAPTEKSTDNNEQVVAEATNPNDSQTTQAPQEIEKVEKKTDESPITANESEKQQITTEEQPS